MEVRQVYPLRPVLHVRFPADLERREDGRLADGAAGLPEYHQEQLL